MVGRHFGQVVSLYNNYVLRISTYIYYNDILQQIDSFWIGKPIVVLPCAEMMTTDAYYV